RDQLGAEAEAAAPDAVHAAVEQAVDLRAEQAEHDRAEAPGAARRPAEQDAHVRAGAQALEPVVVGHGEDRVAVDALVREDRLSAQPVAGLEVAGVGRRARREVLYDLLVDPRQRGARHRRAGAHGADPFGGESETALRRGPEAELPEAATSAAGEDRRVEGGGRHAASS